MSAPKKSSQGDGTVWREFGSSESALERGQPDLPPQQQQIRIQVTRAGKGGKTVTVITGFQAKPETLAALLKQLKSQCGSGGTQKEASLEIQGDHRQKILELLLKLGYKAKLSGG